MEAVFSRFRWSEELLHAHLAAHTSTAEPRCRLAGRRWGPRSTGWRRHRWHKVRGCRWWSSTLLSEDTKPCRWAQERVRVRLLSQNQSDGCVPPSVAPGASCCQRSWRQSWTGPATSVSQRCVHRSSSLRTSPSIPFNCSHTRANRSESFFY